MELRVKEASETAGVSVRTLHHWDKIGLLKPAVIRDNGYRFYTEENLQKLQHIMFFKELDFSLSEIKKIMDSPDFDKIGALISQHELLLKKRIRLDSIIKTLENTIMSTEEGITMSNSKKFKAFDSSDIEEHKKKYADEVKEKYGSSDAWRESENKTSAYSSADWKRITEKGNAVLSEIASHMDKEYGETEVQQAIDKWRMHITDSYYNCTIEILAGLGEMYSSDERFVKNINETRDGLAEFMTEAIKIYCSRN